MFLLCDKAALEPSALKTFVLGGCVLGGCVPVFSTAVFSAGFVRCDRQGEKHIAPNTNKHMVILSLNFHFLQNVR